MPAGGFREGVIRARWAILGLAGFTLAGIGVYLATYAGAVAAAKTEAFVISVATLAAAFWATRSLRMAVVAALAPFATAVFALGILTPVAIAWPALCGVLIPHAIATVLLAIAGLASVVAYCFAVEACVGAGSDAAAWSAVSRFRWPVVSLLVIAAAWRGFLLLPDRVLHIIRASQSTDVSFMAASVTALCGALVCLVLLPLLLGAIRPPESFIASSNRLRERRERLLAELEFVATPRWALALTGIAVVAMVTMFFGARHGTAPVLTLWGAQGLVFPATLVGAGLVAVGGLRDWRAFIVCAAVPAFAASFAAIAVMRLGIAEPIDVGGVTAIPAMAPADMLCMTAALAAGACYVMLARIAAFRRFDDPIEVAFVRVLRELVIPLAGIAAALAIALVPLRLWPIPLAVAIGALIFAPALAAAIEVLFPKLKSVEELYGKRDPG